MRYFVLTGMRAQTSGAFDHDEDDVMETDPDMNTLSFYSFKTCGKNRISFKLKQ